MGLGCVQALAGCDFDRPAKALALGVENSWILG